MRIGFQFDAAYAKGQKGRTYREEVPHDRHDQPDIPEYDQDLYSATISWRLASNAWCPHLPPDEFCLSGQEPLSGLADIGLHPPAKS